MVDVGEEGRRKCSSAKAWLAKAVRVKALLGLVGARSRRRQALERKGSCAASRGNANASNAVSRKVSCTSFTRRNSFSHAKPCESGESKLHCSYSGLRRRKRISKARSISSISDSFRKNPAMLLPFALLACLLAVLLPIGVTCQGTPSITPTLADRAIETISNATARLDEQLADIAEAVVPNQDCIFPYFKEFSDHCISHRYVNGQSLYYHVPPYARGYVVLIHGAGVGRAEDWFVRINRIPMVKRMIDSGLAVAAVQSVSQWRMISRRTDLRNQDASFWRIVEETGMRANLPVFAVCVSRGCQYQGWMAETLHLQGRPIEGQYMSIPWGVTRQFFARSADRMPPTIVSVGGSDTVPLVNTADEVNPWVAAIRGRGVQAHLFVNEQKVVDDCFHTLCEMPRTGGREMTKQLVKEMKQVGVLDESGAIVVPLPAMQGIENPYERLIVDAYMRVNHLQDWPVFSFNRPMIDWIYQELSELQGGHRHTSDFDEFVIAMFLKQTIASDIKEAVMASSAEFL